MASTIFEQTGGTYTQVGDYMLPDLLPAEEEKEANIGVWEMRHKRYLKQNHKAVSYTHLDVYKRQLHGHQLPADSGGAVLFWCGRRNCRNE